MQKNASEKEGEKKLNERDVAERFLKEIAKRFREKSSLNQTIAYGMRRTSNSYKRCSKHLFGKKSRGVVRQKETMQKQKEINIETIKKYEKKTPS